MRIRLPNSIIYRRWERERKRGTRAMTTYKREMWKIKKQKVQSAGKIRNIDFLSLSLLLLSSTLGGLALYGPLPILS
jgi:hypothetical protein